MAFNQYSLDLEASSSQYGYNSSPSAGLKDTGDMTIEGWVKHESLPSATGSQTYISMRDNTSTQVTYTFYLQENSGYYLRLFHRNSSSATDTEEVAWTPSASKWYHLAVVISGSNVLFYVNGEQQGSTQTLSNSRTHNASAVLYFGTNTGSASFHDGLMNHFRFWSDARTQQELQDNMYNFSLSIGVDGLVEEWKFNNDATSESGNNNLTLSGSPTYSTNVPFTGANSTDWTQYQIQSDNTKVSGSSDHTDIPLLIKDGNLSSAVYAGSVPIELNSTPLINDPNLQAYYRFENNGTDSSSNSNTATLTNATYNSTTYKHGAYSVDFDGTGDYLTITDHASMRFGTGDFSLVFWLYMDVDWVSNTGMLWEKSTTGTTFYCNLTTGNKIFVNNLLNSTLTSNSGLSTTTWHHIAIIRSEGGTRQSIYIDGKLDNTNTGTADNMDEVGKDWTFSQANNYWLDGKMDDVAFFNRGLTAQEIRGLAQGGADLRFTTDSAGTTEVPSEIVSLDTSAETCEIWVKYPTLSYNSNSDLYVWYGNSSAVPYDASAPFGSQAVWSDYRGVYHLQTTSDNAQILDSTANAHNSTTNTQDANSSGKIGYAGDYANASSEYTDFGDVTNHEFAGDFTVQAWIYRRTNATTNLRAFSKGAGSNAVGGFAVYGADDTLYSGIGNSTTRSLTTGLTITTDTWYLTSLRRSSTSQIHGLDDLGTGKKETITAVSGTTASGGLSVIGASAQTSPGLYWEGIVDEYRLRAEALSDDWLITEYNNQNSPSTFWAEVGGGKNLALMGVGK